MQSMLRVAEKVVDHDVSVLILGETGVGKDYLAEALHAAGARRARPFLRIDCAAIPPELFESELFGYEAGAFTDAKIRKRGRLEEASGGTLYLDEIAALSPAVQPKLLRAIQEREFQRLGGRQNIRFDLRITASTTVPLHDLTQGTAVRSDLYYRLNVVSIVVPPLRDRRDDIPILVRRFVASAAAALRREVHGVSSDAMTRLVDYSWPGNIRQMRNVVERAVLLAPAGEITVESLPPEIEASGEELLARAAAKRWTIEQLEKEYIERILRETGANYSETARILGINRKTLLEKRRRYGLES